MKFDKVTLTSKGKELAFLLRHDTKAFENGKIEEDGWREVDELIDRGFTKDLLDEIVSTDNKQRYEYNKDGTRIRARQGHSIPVDVGLKEVTPPDILYHGTANRFLDSIREKGLIPGSRLYVHLSSDEETAIKVGSRHGKPFVIKVDAAKMVADGHVVYQSNNGVWLTKQVPIEYLINL